jgi:hypothetical protein
MCLTHLFEVSNVANNPVDNLWIPDGYRFVEAVEFSKTVKCIIFRNDTEMKVSFSSFTFQNLFNFLNIGYQLLSYQGIKMLDENIGMNSFFYYWSNEFWKRTKKVITEFTDEQDTNTLILTGMSMGAAMAQCFYYHFKNSNLSIANTRVLAFGSPRIGNSGIQDWFNNQNDIITNYTICSTVGKHIMVDPVCLFPSEKHGYVNNKCLTVMNNRKVYTQEPYNMKSDTDVNFMNFWNEWSFIKNDDLKVWEAVHQFEEYMKHL